VRARTISAQYVLIDRGRAYAYISGFDPEWARYSLGTLLIAFAIERAIDEGCREFDFLRGREQYKYGWGAVNRATVRLVRGARRDT
jgi:CelD/BcsL family acetyltransferase involved in cellulose biosynthesis